MLSEWSMRLFIQKGTFIWSSTERWKKDNGKKTDLFKRWWTYDYKQNEPVKSLFGILLHSPFWNLNTVQIIWHTIKPFKKMELLIFVSKRFSFRIPVSFYGECQLESHNGAFFFFLLYVYLLRPWWMNLNFVAFGQRLFSHFPNVILI